jgi:hypothetical protein
MMRCQRCFRANEACHRVQSEIMDIAVCDICAEEAKQLGLAIEVFNAFEPPSDDNKLPVRVRARAR